MAKGIDGRVDRIFSRLDGFFDRLFDVHYDKPDAYEEVEVYEPTAPSGTVAAEPKPSEELFGGYSMPKLESSQKPGLLARLLPKQLFAYLEKIYGTKMGEMPEAYIGLASLYNANMNEMLPIYNELARLYSSFEPQPPKTLKRARSKPRKPSEPRSPMGLRTRDKLEY
jgi:hypothetical protein